VGRKLQSCREEEKEQQEEDENAQTLTSPPPPQKNKTNTCHSIKNHLDQLVSSTTTDFRVSIESHAGSTKVTPKLPFSFYTHDLPSSIIES